MSGTSITQNKGVNRLNVSPPAVFVQTSGVTGTTLSHLQLPATSLQATLLAFKVRRVLRLLVRQRPQFFFPKLATHRVTRSLSTVAAAGPGPGTA